MLKYHWLFLLPALWIMGGCVKDDRANCPVPNPEEPRIQFTFKDKDGKDDPNRLKTVQLYVFNQETGVLTDIIQVSPEDLARGYVVPNLPDGKYTMVAWAGSGPDLTQGGFRNGQASGTNPVGYPAATIGTTTLGDFRMMLQTNPPTTPGGPATVTVPQFDDLFHSIATDVVIQNGKPVGKVDMTFTKNSSSLAIHITGVDNVAGPKPLRVFVVGRNGDLLYDDTLDPNAPSIQYNPYSQTNGTTTTDALIKTLRLDMSKETTQPVMLYIQDANGQNVVAPVNVVTAIRQIRDASGNAPYQTQADIDREEQFKLDIAIARSGDGSLNLKVIINGFQPQPLGTTPVTVP
jgi:hypothetical protein